MKNLHLSLISNSNGLIMILMLILESKDSMSQSLELLRVPKIVKMSLSLRPIRETIGGYQKSPIPRGIMDSNRNPASNSTLSFDQFNNIIIQRQSKSCYQGLWLQVSYGSFWSPESDVLPSFYTLWLEIFRLEDFQHLAFDLSISTWLFWVILNCLNC